jgi:uncharacterized membrane protein
MKQKEMFSVKMIALIGVMAAIVYAVTLYRFPLMGSKVHLANGICLLAGMLLGPIPGGLAAGLGSAIYDATLGGYDFINVMITFVSKFAMGFVCGLLLRVPKKGSFTVFRVILSGIAGALTYVFLYMVKTFVYQRFVYGYPLDAVGVTMWAKLVPSLINALAAVVAAPLLYHALLIPLRAAHVLPPAEKQE